MYLSQASHASHVDEFATSQVSPKHLEYGPGAWFSSVLEQTFGARKNNQAKAMRQSLTGVLGWLKRHPAHCGKLGRVPALVFRQKVRMKTSRSTFYRYMRQWVDEGFISHVVIQNASFVDLSFFDDVASRRHHSQFKQANRARQQVCRETKKYTSSSHGDTHPPSKTAQTRRFEPLCGVSRRITDALAVVFDEHDFHQAEHNFGTDAVRTTGRPEPIKPLKPDGLALSPTNQQAVRRKGDVKSVDESQVERETQHFMEMCKGIRERKLPEIPTVSSKLPAKSVPTTPLAGSYTQSAKPAASKSFHVAQPEWLKALTAGVIDPNDFCTSAFVQDALSVDSVLNAWSGMQKKLKAGQCVNPAAMLLAASRRYELGRWRLNG
jgi:hypothetical protein